MSNYVYIKAYPNLLKQGGSSSITNNLTSADNTMTSVVNTNSSSAPIVNTNTLELNNVELKSIVNGMESTPVKVQPIISSPIENNLINMDFTGKIKNSGFNINIIDPFVNPASNQLSDNLNIYNFVTSITNGSKGLIPVKLIFTTNQTLRGLPTQAGYTCVDNDRVICISQTDPRQNVIYNVHVGDWSIATDSSTVAKLIGSWVPATQGDYLDNYVYLVSITPTSGNVTPTSVTWSTPVPSGIYQAGTGLSLTGSVFSIANTAVTPGDYGGGNKTLGVTINPQGQVIALSAIDISLPTSQLTGGVSITQGGTGATTQQAAVNNLAGAASEGQYMRFDGTNWKSAAIQSTDIPTLNQSTTGNAATATIATRSTNLAGGEANQLAYQTGVNTTAFISTANNAILKTSATGVPGYTIYKTPKITRFTASGTWTPDSSAEYVIIECLGAGGGSSSATSVTGGIAISNSGGGGGYIKALFPRQLAAQVVTIGTSVAGAPGGASSVGTLASASGGQAGSVLITARINSIITNGTTPTAGGAIGFQTGGTTILAMGGQEVSSALLIAIDAASSAIVIIPPGGNSALGIGGRSGQDYSTIGLIGNSGSGFGGGGGGASASNGAIANGVAGTNGIAIITEYYF